MAPLLMRPRPFPWAEVLVICSLASLMLVWVAWVIGQPSAVEPMTIIDAPPPSVFVVDTGRLGGFTGPVPKTPFPSQKKPPCGSEEVAINGGCWVQITLQNKSGKCPDNYYSRDTGCYLPVFMPLRTPTSIGD